MERLDAVIHRIDQLNAADPNLEMNLGLELVRSGDLERGLPHYRQAFHLMTNRESDEIAPELRPPAWLAPKL